MKIYQFRLISHRTFFPKGPINNIPALVQIMAWRRPGDKPLSEPMLVRLSTNICVSQPQSVNLSRLAAGLDTLTAINTSSCSLNYFVLLKYENEDMIDSLPYHFDMNGTKRTFCQHEISPFTQISMSID